MEPKDPKKNDQATEPDEPKPSRTKTLVYVGVVALVCGILGAWGYSHVFGSNKSDSRTSSSKDSGSGTGGPGGSSGGPGSSGTSGSKPSSGSSGEGKNTGGSQGSAQRNVDTRKLVEAEAAWLTAEKELQQARAGEKAARQTEDDLKKVVTFLKRTLLIAGRPGGVSLAEAFWAGGQGKDVTLRKAVDHTESQVGQSFADRPLAEAIVREMLGLAYLGLGEPGPGVKQYERAYTLREGTQGVNDPETAECRNQLAVAYRLANRPDDASRLFERNPGSAGHASALAVRGAMLPSEQNPIDAERMLRESLSIREKIEPDDWTTFDTKSLLGAALLDQEKFADAEPLLISGYEGLKQHQDRIPSHERARVTSALQRLVKLYDAWGKKDQAMKWRRELDRAG
jgi:tetratricopeptide (TPR) repeat protein